MEKFRRFIRYFTAVEWAIWLCSVILIISSFCIFDKSSILTLISPLLGVTSLIFCAKGNPIGQLLMVIFGLLYGLISLIFGYYGETITYWGMALPTALCALISWLKNPFNGNKAEVKISFIKKWEIGLLSVLAVLVTIGFYFILKALNTANLGVSTFSVLTSFIAAYLAFRRSPYFALAYSVNDIVLIILWGMAAMVDLKYISVTVCFIAFLAGDLYGFINWIRIRKRQSNLA